MNECETVLVAAWLSWTATEVQVLENVYGHHGPSAYSRGLSQTSTRAYSVERIRSIASKELLGGAAGQGQQRREDVDEMRVDRCA